MSGSPAVEARGWGWRHPGREAWAVRGLDLRIEEGERVLLLGPSGSGKSTLLAALAGLLDPAGGGESEGVLLTHGLPPHRTREATGLLFQDPDDQIVLGRVGDDVAFGLENRCVPAHEIWPRVHAALDDVGFPCGADRSTHALSGGERQRVALAGVLAMRPRLLLLDEPTATLDATGSGELHRVLRSVVAEREPTAIVVDHRPNDWTDLVDRVVVIEAGRLQADGNPRRVLQEADAAAPDMQPGRPQTRPDRRRPEERSLVVARDASFRYPGSTTWAVTGIDLRVIGGGGLAITGPNGSGKSTLALLLGGLLKPTRGDVVAGDALVAGHAGEALWRWPARRLGGHVATVFQNPEHQFLCGRVDDELALGPRRVGLPEDVVRRRVSELLERLRLAPLAAANPFTLSGGEKRRLSVGSAIAASPALLVLDEPTLAQDAATYRELVALLASMREDGTGLCLVTHDETLIAALADTRLCLEAGTPA